MSLNIMPVSPNDVWQWWQLIVAPLFVALCIFLGGLAWAAARAAGHWIKSCSNQVIVKRPIRLGWAEEAIAEQLGEGATAVRLYCLVVRFGTDPYLADMASDRERHEGRLLNRPIEIRRASDMILALPVHRRLGTQFKLYYLVPEGKAVGLRVALGEAQAKRDPEAGDKIILDYEQPRGRKLWFRLAAYRAQAAVDGSENSFFAASELPGFERGNRLGFWR